MYVYRYSVFKSEKLKTAEITMNASWYFQTIKDDQVITAF